jgi:hypothetical protein
VVSSDSLEFHNGNGLIHFKTTAALFTTMGADAAKHPGERQIPHYDFNGFPVLALFHHLNVTLNVDMSRACFAARGPILFLYGKCPGNGLGIGFVSGLPGCQPQIIFTGANNRTDLYAIPTSRAGIGVNIAGGLL